MTEPRLVGPAGPVAGLELLAPLADAVDEAESADAVEPAEIGTGEEAGVEWVGGSDAAASVTVRAGDPVE